MKFFKELQRRNVIRVAIGYIVSSWLLIQIADLALDIIGSPDWVLRTIALVMGLGFPVVVFFSWAYEVTPDGIKRESEIDRTQSITHVTGRKLDRAIVAMLAVALAYFAYDKFVLDPKRDDALIEDIRQNVSQQSLAEAQVAAEEVGDPASIAVLPFADLSPDKDQGYFSDGIAEEILNVLVGVDGLSVASRTSAFGFKTRSSLGIPAIAEALKVRNILEGSVRKSGANIRITAQLIDARTDKHLWSQTYDRVLSAENLFAIQDEIARAIVAELSSSLQLESPALDAPMVSVATENLDAYQLFLRAREMFRQRSQDNIPVIYQMLEQAIELDPDFARAWAGLAAVSYIAPSWGVTDRDYQQRAQEAAQRALELDDSLALPYAVLGAMQTLNAPSDFVTAFEYYEQALERDSNAVNALLWRGIDLLRVGIFNAAIADFESCLVIDPAYENCRRFLALANLFLGQTETALLLFEEGLAKGNTSQVDEFIFAYVDERDRRSGMLTLAWFNQAYGDDGINVETLYRALTEPGFDYSLEWQNFLADYEARTGKSSADLGRSAFYALAFRRYDDLVIHPFNMIWWNPHLTDFVASPIRNKFIRQMGIDDYWRQAGFPPQCRPIGEDDFACD